MSIFVNYFTFMIFTLVSLLILYIKWSHAYWKRKGVNYIQPKFLFGNVKDSLTRKKALFDVIIELYKQFKEKDIKYGGFYFLTRPILMVLDLELIKCILVRDFEYFTSHGTYCNEVVEPLTGNLFNLEGVKWKTLRAKLSLTFTLNQMKMMFQTLAKCAPGLTKILEKHSQNSEIVDIKDILSRFTLDVIGNCVYGIECNTMEKPNSEFEVYSKKMFRMNPKIMFRRAMSQILPKRLISLLGIKINDQEVANFFMDVVKQNASYRENNNIFRKDFFHLLLQLKNRGELTDDGSIKEKSVKAESLLNIDEIAAHCYFFFGAGYESSSSTMAFALYEIANDPKLQDRCREDVLQALAKHDGQLKYETVMEMSYLEKVIYETLRKYSPAPVLPRKCTKPYNIPGTDVTIEKGTTVYIPIPGIQLDPLYYPEPEKFDPERFSEEEKRLRPQYTWLPFGEGPRICIGLRFGVIVAKVGLATIIKDFRLKVNSKTISPLVMEGRLLGVSVKGGIWLDVERL